MPVTPDGVPDSSHFNNMLKMISSSKTLLGANYPILPADSACRLRGDAADRVTMDDEEVRQSKANDTTPIDYAFRAASLTAEASSGLHSYAQAIGTPF